LVEARSSAVRVLDCVLSLNRRYDRFVVPRLNEFQRSHPDILTVADLDAMVAQAPSPASFFARTLRYRDPGRAETLAGVCRYLLEVLQEFPADTEERRLELWAGDRRPGDYLSVSVRGFGLAGFQYLRMLFGANTTKPDVHVRRYVGNAVGHTVTDVQALYLLERAVRGTTLNLRRVDAGIWEAGARGEAEHGDPPDAQEDALR